MSEQSKYVVHTVALPHGELDINADGPRTLIGDAFANQNLLGALPIENSDEPNWVCILPLQQPQADREGAACAGMNTPVAERWCTIDELNHDLLAPNMRFVLSHLEESGTAVGFNYSPDPRTRPIAGTEMPKFKPNSWDHFHMHWMTGIPESAQEITRGDTVSIQTGHRSIEVRPHRFLREMLPHVIEGVLDQEFRRPVLGFNEFNDYIAAPGQRARLPYASDGGITFALPVTTFGDPRKLGATIKAVHDTYVEVHSKVWQVFTSNYEDVVTSGWSKGYQLRQETDITERIVAFTDDVELRKGLTRFFTSLRPESEVASSMNWLYKGPSHSMALYKHESTYILSLLPHLMHPTNWLAALGVFEARGEAPEALDAYRDQARAHAIRLGAHAVPTMLDLPSIES